MQTLATVLGCVVPLAVVFVIWANVRRPLRGFLAEYLDENLARLGTVFVSVVLFFFALRYSVGSLAQIPALGIGRFISHLCDPALSAMSSSIRVLQWVGQTAAIFFVGYAVLKKTRPGASEPAPQAPAGAEEESGRDSQ